MVFLFFRLIIGWTIIRNGHETVQTSWNRAENFWPPFDQSDELKLTLNSKDHKVVRIGSYVGPIVESDAVPRIGSNRFFLISNCLLVQTLLTRRRELNQTLGFSIRFGSILTRNSIPDQARFLTVHSNGFDQHLIHFNPTIWTWKSVNFNFLIRSVLSYRIWTITRYFNSWLRTRTH